VKCHRPHRLVDRLKPRGGAFRARRCLRPTHDPPPSRRSGLPAAARSGCQRLAVTSRVTEARCRERPARATCSPQRAPCEPIGIPRRGSSRPGPRLAGDLCTAKSDRRRRDSVVCDTPVFVDRTTGEACSGADMRRFRRSFRPGRDAVGCLMSQVAAAPNGHGIGIERRPQPS
jgi:hypothetical protein